MISKFLRLEVQDQCIRRTGSFWRLWGTDHSMPASCAGGWQPLVFLGCSSITLASIFTWLCPLCIPASQVSFCFSLIRTPKSGWSHPKILSNICKDTFSKQNHIYRFWRLVHGHNFFEDHYSTHSVCLMYFGYLYLGYWYSRDSFSHSEEVIGQEQDTFHTTKAGKVQVGALVAGKRCSLNTDLTRCVTSFWILPLLLYRVNMGIIFHAKELLYTKSLFSL